MRFLFAKQFKSQVPLVYPLFFQKKKFLRSGKPIFDRLVEKAIKSKIFEGNAGEIHAHYSERPNLPKTIVFISLGDPKKLRASKILNHLGGAVRELKKQKGVEVSLMVSKELEPYAQTIAEAFVLTNYDPAQFKTGKAAKKRKEHDLKTCTFVGAIPRQFRENIEKGGFIAEAVNYVRDLVNGPPNIVSTEYVEKEAQKTAKEFGHTIKVFHKKDLVKLGMNGILAVNRGSKSEARLIILEYRPEGKMGSPIALVGKGIIFDSGGYNLKPTGFIEEMHLDMAGAAAVLGIFRLLKKLHVPHHIIGLIPITENCIDAEAYKPSEIITMYNGKTVEITNTDAEGRLILGDAMAYAVKQWKPRYLIDIATLTGACMIALGDRFAGLFGNDKELKKLLERAGKETDELVWPMPMHPDFDAAMKGEISDLRNGEEMPRYAGASKGAAFLKAFVGKTKWAHLDIAGVAFVKNPKKYETKRATGYGVRLMTRFFELLHNKL